MSLLDCLLISLFNAVICITLPKMLSVFSEFNAKRNKKLADNTITASYAELAPKQTMAKVASLP